MIHDLTTTEMETIAERYAGHHHCAEFWTGFAAYQNETGRYSCPHDYHSPAGQAWHQGSDAAMHVRWKRGIQARDEYERDDRESALQIATLKRGVEERQERHAVAAVHARVMKPGRYPRLHLAGGKRTGRVGADRFRGRYHPHLIWDRDASNIPLAG
jgi:hypothetical protein